jgi:23S rRNA (cytidine1920-2'-O)/16S rRNA (cytidine1409-2'-O)-methyltransferase
MIALPRPPRTPKERADLLLVRSGLAADAAEAQALILAGKVFIGATPGQESQRVKSAGERLDGALSFRVDRPSHPYVSRGGLKLAAALDAFRIDPAGRVAADIGVSTGGFTDVLLMRGAARVHAVDVGYGQTAWKIRSDPRVRLMERTNARLLADNAFGERVSLMVIDLSFIGLGQVLPALLPQLAPGAELIALVKPQFEVDPSEVGDGGIVVDPEARRRAVDRVRATAGALGLSALGEIESPIQGADGNVEHLLGFRYAPSSEKDDAR